MLYDEERLPPGYCGGDATSGFCVLGVFETSPPSCCAPDRGMEAPSVRRLKAPTPSREAG
ncbi:MAG: hypothetical protein IPP68_05080 [Elusimicrobia bacterium]|nr:hypothetical protein [Elusimicrobiota bacterium]